MPTFLLLQSVLCIVLVLLVLSKSRKSLRRTASCKKDLVIEAPSAGRRGGDGEGGLGAGPAVFEPPHHHSGPRQPGPVSASVASSTRRQRRTPGLLSRPSELVCVRCPLGGTWDRSARRVLVTLGCFDPSGRVVCGFSLCF